MDGARGVDGGECLESGMNGGRLRYIHYSCYIGDAM